MHIGQYGIQAMILAKAPLLEDFAPGEKERGRLFVPFESVAQTRFNGELNRVCQVITTDR